jgi:putative membrane protein
MINGNFLLAVFLGIATSILSIAKLVTTLLENHPIQVWSFFFGLILISAPLVLREIKKWNPVAVLSLLLGIFVSYMLTLLTPSQTPDALWFVYLAGTLAICAMILPGISGAFILLLLGKYEFIINGLIQMNIPVIIVFILGCITGLLLFSRALTWILQKYHTITIALLAGFMLGSLNKVWPWKEVISYRFNTHGEQIPAFDRSILPGTYLEKVNEDPQVFQAILMMALGILLVVVMEKIASRLKPKI